MTMQLTSTDEIVSRIDGSVDTAQVTLRFTDGESRQFSAAAGQPVLDAARAAGHTLVSQCEVGTCGTCVATLRSGQADMPSDRPMVLSQDEVALGERLLCQARACSSEVELDVDYPSTLLDANPAVAFRGKISALTWLAESVVELELKLPKALRLGFTAGQYCRIQVPGTDQWRSYSMASGENEKGKLAFLIRILPEGAMSDYLRTQASVGDILELEGPKGGFVLTPEYRPHILMAGGTGLAPMLSMLSRLRYVRPEAPPLLLLFGCTNAEQLFHVEELAARMQFMPMLTVRTVLQDNSGAPEVPQGNPVTALQPEDIHPDSVAYLCGPPGMLHAAEEKLLSLGLDRSDIRMEQFLDSAN